MVKQIQVHKQTYPVLCQPNPISPLAVMSACKTRGQYHVPDLALASEHADAGHRYLRVGRVSCGDFFCNGTRSKPIPVVCLSDHMCTW
jgi:hypothetical protein